MQGRFLFDLGGGGSKIHRSKIKKLKMLDLLLVMLM
jgi:hypothetical protein